MGDIYLEKSELLKGKPKLTIGDYVEQNGVLVPKRLENLQEAQGSKT